MRVEAVHERAVKVEDRRARRMEGHSANLPRTHGYDSAMRTPSNARAALLLAALAVVSALPGCKPMNPRPAVAPPPQEAVLKGGRHSKRRDAEAIHHHYDVSNQFYSWVLGPSMAYTCAVFPDAEASLETAQYNKFDLVCRKLGLQPGMTLLDIGCGWGGMVMHAAEHYGVKAIGVTLSKEQAAFAQNAIKERGLEGSAEVRFSDYRDVPETNFDAISSIGLTEHIGRENYPSYFAFGYSKLKPLGRMLNHTITRPDDSEQSYYKNGFINRYVFPDGELSGPAHIMSVMNSAGFEIRHEENLREHYALTLKYWCENLEAHWDEAVAEAGLGTARVWRLYMAASRLGFDLNTIQLHQTLGVKLGESGVSGFPYRGPAIPAAF